MNVFDFKKIYIHKNGKSFFLDIPVGATWSECIDVTIEFAHQIQTLRDASIKQAQEKESVTETTDVTQEIKE